MGEALEIAVGNSERMVDFFCVKSNSNKKKHKQTKIFPGVENQ